ncbi:hypothetical protein QBC38DRAFT_249943 [Podospora fimiseda]|uniref:Uncharacterized protein n=1 Tax=Podospora fimiseda TaxID=252190 RepID=A0AAN7GWP4_9PEZI|nr:hypothetical protein QBC38DRAFT_249943 [Podospora fimiseda]
MTNLKSLLVATTAATLAAIATAEFTNSFDGIIAGSDVKLSWGSQQSQQATRDLYLCVTAQVIDRGDGEGSGKVDVYKVNVTTTATGNEYTWTGVPYPLRRIKNGLYQVEVRDCSGLSTNNTVLAKSPFFSVEEEDPGVVVNPDPDTSSSTGSSDEKKKGPPAINKTALGIGLGVAIGVPSIAGLVVVGWCFRKRQKRAAEERRRARRREFVIY